MSDPHTIGVNSAGTAAVRQAIARAADRTGVDFQYLLAQAKVESALDPSAKAGTSSAAGLYQFTKGTWLQTLGRHGSDHGLGWAKSAIEGGRVADPQVRSQIMALRFDPDASAMMAAELARDNHADLAGKLGRDPDAAELYLAHFLGSAGAGRFLNAMEQNPEKSAAALMPGPAAANRSIFFNAGGSPRSLAGVMDLIRAKMDRSMDDGNGELLVAGSGASQFVSSASQDFRFAGPIANEFHSVRQSMPDAAMSAPSSRSMAETLQSAFAMGGERSKTEAPAFVQAAYSKLSRFGL